MLIGLLLFGGFCFALGIVIRIRKDGHIYEVELPEGSRTVIDQNGNPTVIIAPKPETGEAIIGGKSSGKPEKSVNMGGSLVTDATLEQLKGSPQLESLNLANANVTDAGMKWIKDLTKLQLLDLTFTGVKDEGLGCLDGLTNLRSLSLHGVEVTDAGIEHLKGLTKLNSLDLTFTKVTDAGLEYLKGLTKLQSLDLVGIPQITDAGLQNLKCLPQLESLNLMWTHQITDAGLEHLEGLTTLQSLNLHGTSVTDAGLVHLKGLTKLKFLDLSYTTVTDAGVRALRQALPSCQINSGQLRVSTQPASPASERRRGMDGMQPKAQQPTELPLQFGPVIERVVNALGEGKGGEGLDLVGGKLVDVPKEFGGWSAEQQNKWSTENNVDLVVNFVAGVGLGDPHNKSLALIPQGLKLAAIWQGRWDIAISENLRSRLRQLRPRR